MSGQFSQLSLSAFRL